MCIRDRHKAVYIHTYTHTYILSKALHSNKFKIQLKPYYAESTNLNEQRKCLGMCLDVTLQQESYIRKQDSLILYLDKKYNFIGKNFSNQAN